MIFAHNARCGSEIPTVNLATVATATSSSSRPSPGGRPVYPMIEGDGWIGVGRDMRVVPAVVRR